MTCICFLTVIEAGIYISYIICTTLLRTLPGALQSFV